MEIEGDVFDLEVKGLAELVDPSLADVAPRSNKVAENDQPGWHVVHTG
jgi:hypothetical protein